MGSALSLLYGGFALYSTIFGGLTTNILQLLVFIFIQPFFNNLALRLNRYLARLAWAPLVALLEPSIQLVTCGSAVAWEKRKENAVAIANHVGELDWLACWTVAEREGNISASKVGVKKSIIFFPKDKGLWRRVEWLARQRIG